MWIDLLLPLLGIIASTLGHRYLGARKWTAISSGARQALESANNQITSPKDALEKAIILANHREIARGVERLHELARQGKLEIRAAEEAGRARAELVTSTVIEREP
jgi:hypothetical protein